MNALKEFFATPNDRLDHSPPHTTAMHIPAPLAFAAVMAEFAGGIGLISGVASRLAAASIAMVSGKYGLFMNWFGNQKGEGCEYHLLAIAVAKPEMPATRS